MNPSARPGWLRWLLRLLALGGVLLFLVLWVQVFSARLTKAEVGVFKKVATTELRPLGEAREIKVMAWNLAKCGVDAQAPRVVPPAATLARLNLMAEVIRREDPDLLVLSEVVWRTPYRSINQVRHLAEACGYRHYAFGENVHLGLPFFRYVGGNAILSKWPLDNGVNPNLSGHRPFWITRNSRRALLVDARLGQQTVRVAALHLDSFVPENNRVQVGQILSWVGSAPALLAGDFNAPPDSPSLRAIQETRRYAGSVDGPKTFPSDRPERRIDYVLGPAHWRETAHYTTGGTVSDHLAVVSVFLVRGPDAAAP
jgi:endonuclease/exonuclease/phosphatase family metal-dependent hydrolase